MWPWIACAALLVALLGGLLLWRRRRRIVERQPPLPLQHSVVLVHGAFGFDKIGIWRLKQHYFRGVIEHLERLGVDVHLARVPSLGTIAQRAQTLTDFVRSLGKSRVILVGHSMGGLDARYAVSRLGLNKHVSCIVTVGSPHRGTPIARVGGWAPVRVLRWLARRVGVVEAGIDCLTESAMRGFNEDVSDVPGVSYYSVVAVARWGGLSFSPLMWLTHWYLTRSVGDNDAMVPTSSQRWGEVISRIEANHWAQIGWSWRFDAGRLYERLLRQLAQLGY